MNAQAQAQRQHYSSAQDIYNSLLQAHAAQPPRIDTETDKRRIDVLLQINTILLKKCVELQAYCLNSGNSNNPDYGQKKELYQNYLKRIHFNLTCLASINDIHSSAPNAPKKNYSIPQIVIPPAEIPELADYYKLLNQLYPEAIPLFQKRMELAKQQQLQQQQQQNRGFNQARTPQQAQQQPQLSQLQQQQQMGQSSQSSPQNNWNNAPHQPQPPPQQQQSSQQQRQQAYAQFLQQQQQQQAASRQQTPQHQFAQFASPSNHSQGSNENTQNSHQPGNSYQQQQQQASTPFGLGNSQPTPQQFLNQRYNNSTVNGSNVSTPHQTTIQQPQPQQAHPNASLSPEQILARAASVNMNSSMNTTNNGSGNNSTAGGSNGIMGSSGGFLDGW